MDRINTVLYAVRRRLWVNLALDAFARLLVPAMALSGVCVGAQRLLAVELPRGAAFAPLCVALLLAPLLAQRRLPDDVSLAALIDHRLGLKDTLATALFARSRRADDEFSQQLLQRAHLAAGAIVPARAMPLQLSRAWRGAAAAAALALLWTLFLPHADPLGRDARRRLAAQRRAADKDARERIVNVSQTVEKLRQESPELADPESVEAAKLAESIARQPLETDEQRREAQAKLSAVEEKLAAAADRREEAFRGMETTLSSLDTKSPGPADRFTDAMRRGDYDAARNEIRELGRQADAMPPREREQLKRQLETLSKQLAQAAREQEKKRDQLEKERDAQAGDTKPGDAKNPTDAADPRRADELEQRARAADDAARNASRLSESLDRMAKSIDPGAPRPAPDTQPSPRPPQEKSADAKDPQSPPAATQPQGGKSPVRDNKKPSNDPDNSPHDSQTASGPRDAASPRNQQADGQSQQPTPSQRPQDSQNPANPRQADGKTQNQSNPSGQHKTDPTGQPEQSQGKPQDGSSKPTDTPHDNSPQNTSDQRTADAQRPANSDRETNPRGAPQQAQDPRESKPGDAKTGDAKPGDSKSTQGSDKTPRTAEGSHGEKPSDSKNGNAKPAPGSDKDQRTAEGSPRETSRDAADKVSDDLSQLSKMREQARQLRDAQSQTRDAMRELGPDGDKPGAPGTPENPGDPGSPGVTGDPSKKPGNVARGPEKSPGRPNQEEPSPGGGVGGTRAGTDGDAKPTGTPTRVDAFKPSTELDTDEGQGRVIARWLENGPMKRGEAKQAYDSALRDARRDAEQAVIDDRVPRQYHDTILKYFDQAPASPEKVAPPAK